jgi:gliding motility-associated-like protein
MKHFGSILLLLTIVSTASLAQTDLAGRINFDNCIISDPSGNIDSLIAGSAAVCDCGLQGDALFFNGNDQFLRVQDSTLNFLFSRLPFAISFYFKPGTGTGLMPLFSKKEDCLGQVGFYMKYNGATQQIITEFSESGANRVLITQAIDTDRCWQHVVIMRGGTTVRLYINGTLREENRSGQTINLANNRELEIGTGPCVGSTDVRFNGHMEDIRFFSRDLTILEVQDLFIRQDKVNNRDTTIYLGNSVTVRPEPNCANAYIWFPQNGVSNPNIADPVITPDTSTTYFVNFNYGTCLSRDTLRITVIDPSQLDCNILPMPTAFTPNGDNLNEVYGISNPFSFEELIVFEIFDRNGSKLFSTSNAFDNWDGQFHGDPMPNSAYLFLIKYRCKGEEIIKKGSFHLLR